MTAGFLDASAIVKLYADEADRETARRISTPVVSDISRVEVPSAIWRKSRMGELSLSDAAVLVAAFEADWHGTTTEPPRFLRIAVNSALLRSAAQLVRAHPLRAYDAVQLAAGLAAFRVEPECVVFVTFDRRLEEVALTCGLSSPGK